LQNEANFRPGAEAGGDSQMRTHLTGVRRFLVLQNEAKSAGMDADKKAKLIGLAVLQIEANCQAPVLRD